jgi:hypothetical protein
MLCGYLCNLDAASQERAKPVYFFERASHAMRVGLSIAEAGERGQESRDVMLGWAVVFFNLDGAVIPRAAMAIAA